MSLFRFRWLRKMVRRHTNPIEEDKAAVWKQRLSIGYAICAWNAFGFVCYMIFTGRNDWAKHYGLKTEADSQLGPAQFYAKQLGMDKAHVIRMSGIEKKAEYDIDEPTNKFAK